MELESGSHKKEEPVVASAKNHLTNLQLHIFCLLLYPVVNMQKLFKNGKYLK